MDLSGGTTSKASRWVRTSAFFVAPFQVPQPDGHAKTGGIILAVLVAALAAAITALVRIMDRARMRSEEAGHLQARIADALVAENLSITVRTEVPRWRHRPVTIDVRGAAPSPKLRDDALALAIREATRSGLDFRVVDRVAVVPPSLSRRAA